MTGVSSHRYYPTTASVGSNNEDARKQDTDILQGGAGGGYRDTHNRDLEDGAKPWNPIEEQRQRCSDLDAPNYEH